MWGTQEGHFRGNFEAIPPGFKPDPVGLSLDVDALQT
jgi:hypothetical protein